MPRMIYGIWHPQTNSKPAVPNRSSTSMYKGTPATIDWLLHRQPGGLHDWYTPPLASLDLRKHWHGPVMMQEIPRGSRTGRGQHQREPGCSFFLYVKGVRANANSYSCRAETASSRSNSRTVSGAYAYNSHLYHIAHQHR